MKVDNFHVSRFQIIKVDNIKVKLFHKIKVGTWAASISICFSTSTNTWYSTEGHECLATEVVLGDHVVVHQGEAQHRLRQLALLTTARAGET